MAKTEELQKQTLRVLTEMGTAQKPLSARAAGEKLGIGYNQISDMAKGKSPGEKTLIKWASAIGEPPSDWLHHAGKHEFARSLDSADAEEEDPEHQMARQIARELSRVPLERQPLLLRQLRALIRASVGDDDNFKIERHADD